VSSRPRSNSVLRSPYAAPDYRGLCRPHRLARSCRAASARTPLRSSARRRVRSRASPPPSLCPGAPMKASRWCRSAESAPHARCSKCCVEECLRAPLGSMGWHQVLLCSLVGSCSREFVYELVYIRAVFCESTYDYRYRFYSTFVPCPSGQHEARHVGRGGAAK
jgi:hypothetical protein